MVDVSTSISAALYLDGGWGAKHDSDGTSTTIAINDGDTYNGPSEQVEAKFPLLVERYCAAPGFRVGPARTGAGSALSRSSRRAAKSASTPRSTGSTAALGALRRACRRKGNGVALHRFGADEHRYPSGKAFNLVLKPGDAYILRSGGGGGFGPPLERDPARVEGDVRQGYVTEEAAREFYGVVIGDPDATTELRKRMKAEGLPLDMCRMPSPLIAEAAPPRPRAPGIQPI